MTIPLAPALLTGSSNLPGSFRRAALERFPIWSCSVWGFACHFCCQKRGALLPHLFTLTLRLARIRALAQGGMFSVPLVRRVSPPGNYPAHCSVEFGLSSPERTSRAELNTDRIPRSSTVAVTLGSGHPANCNAPLSHAHGPRAFGARERRALAHARARKATLAFARVGRASPLSAVRDNAFPRAKQAASPETRSAEAYASVSCEI